MGSELLARIRGWAVLGPGPCNMRCGTASGAVDSAGGGTRSLKAPAAAQSSSSAAVTLGAMASGEAVEVCCRPHDESA